MKRTSAVAAMIQAVSPVSATGTGAADCASANNGHSSRPSASGARIVRALISIPLVSGSRRTVNRRPAARCQQALLVSTLVIQTNGLPPEGQQAVVHQS